MRIRVASDLHLEGFRGAKVHKLVERFLPRDSRDIDSYLVLAGDISSDLDQLVNFLSYVEPHFKHVIYVPGNHEYYGHDIKKWRSEYYKLETELSNTTMADTATLKVFKDVVFVAGTLWADAGKSYTDQFLIQRAMSDFYVISNGHQKFTAEDMRILNKYEQSNFSRLLAKARYATEYAELPVVAVSHHLPSYHLCHPRFGLQLNGGFASNCDELLVGHDAPTLWIHGHTHDTIDTVLGSTRIVCNPAGYSGETSQNIFNSFEPKFIDI